MSPTSGSSATLNGVISGAHNLSKSSNGTITLTGANTYSGLTVVSGGELILGSTTALGNTSAVFLTGALNGTIAIGFSNATLGYTGNITIGTTTAGGKLLFNGTNSILNNPIIVSKDASFGGTGSGTITGIVSGAHNLTMVGTGLVTLSGNNSYSGSTTISSGTLSIGSTTGLGNTTGTTVASGGTLDFSFNNGTLNNSNTININGTGATAGALTFSGTNSKVNNSIVMQSNSSLGGTGSGTLGGVISGAYNLTQVGSATITLSGVNTYSGTTTINAGELSLSSVGSLGSTSSTTVSATGATLDIAFNSGTLTNTNTINLNGTGIGGAGALTITGNSDTLNNPIALQSSSSIGGTGTGILTLGGPITGTNTNLTINLTNAGISLPTVTLTTSGNLIVTTNGGITLNGAITAGNSIVLAGTGFTNNTGSSALNPGTGNFQVWSTNPANDNRGGLVYNYKQYNATYGVTSVLGTGNGFLYTIAPSITTSLTGTVSKSYTGTTAATLTPSNYTYTGNIDGDTITLNNPANGTYASPNVGTNINIAVTGISIISAANGSATVYGYQLASTTANANVGTISTAALNITANDATKIYGQTTTFTGTEFTSTGLQNGETIGSTTLSSAGAINTANVDTSPYNINVSAATGGTFNPSNYTVSYQKGTLTVSPATLTYIANQATRAVGEANPALSGSVTGFVLGQTQATATTGTMAFTTPANTTSSAGNYPITGSGLSANNNNYTFVQVSGNTTALIVRAVTTAVSNKQTIVNALNPFMAGNVNPVNPQASGQVSITIVSATKGVGLSGVMIGGVPSGVAGTKLPNIPSIIRAETGGPGSGGGPGTIVGSGGTGNGLATGPAGASGLTSTISSMIGRINLVSETLPTLNVTVEPKVFIMGNVGNVANLVQQEITDFINLIVTLQNYSYLFIALLLAAYIILLLRIQAVKTLSFKMRNALNTIKVFTGIFNSGQVGPITTQEKEYLNEILLGAQLISDELKKIESKNIIISNNKMFLNLRTALMDINGYTDLLVRMKYLTTPEQKECLKEIKLGSKNIMRLITA